MKAKNIANYSILPTLLIVIVSLFLYTTIQNVRFFNPGSKLSTFNAIKNLKQSIKLKQKELVLAQKKPKLYQELFIINIVLLLLIVCVCVYYFMDWDLLIFALLDILTV